MQFSLVLSGVSSYFATYPRRPGLQVDPRAGKPAVDQGVDLLAAIKTNPVCGETVRAGVPYGSAGSLSMDIGAGCDQKAAAGAALQPNHGRFAVLVDVDADGVAGFEPNRLYFFYDFLMARIAPVNGPHGNPDRIDAISVMAA
jgi:hypothetical protein